MAAPKGGGQEFMKRNCLREISYWKEWRGWGPGADTGGEASPLGAFDPRGNFLDGKLSPYLGETTAATETRRFWWFGLPADWWLDGPLSPNSIRLPCMSFMKPAS